MIRVVGGRTGKRAVEARVWKLEHREQEGPGTLKNPWMVCDGCRPSLSPGEEILTQFFNLSNAD